MRVSRHRRQVILFVIAVLVPAGVLIGLAARMINQDRELTAKRALEVAAALPATRRFLATPGVI